MKVSPFFFALLWLTNCLKAQQIPTKDVNIGQFVGIDKLIKGTEYTLSDRIYGVHFDSINQYISIELRGIKNERRLNNTGKLVLLYPKNKQIIWSEKMNYLGQSLLQADDLILKYSGKSESLNPHNGQTLWSNNTGIFRLNKQNTVGVGYGLMKAERLYGVDLKTGDDLWHRDIARDYGWNGSYQINDSTLLILASGVHSINLNNGKGWDFDMVTGKKDYSGTVAANIAGVALGLLTGTFMFTSGHSTVTEVASNALVKDDKIYVASKQKVACLDFAGKLQWLTAIPKDSTSKSSIFIHDSTVFMVNYGYAFFNGEQIPFGKPFIAAFDELTGRKKYQESIENVDFINDYEKRNNEIMLLTNNKLLKYDLISGKLITDIAIKNTKDDPLKSFVGDQIFEKNNDDTYQSVVRSDTSNWVIATQKNTLITFDKDLNALKEQDFDQLYVKRKHGQNIIFLKNKNEIIVLDQSHKAKAIIKGDYNCFFTNSKVFLSKDNQLIDVNIEEFNP
jgi:PQQ-like domain